jgi:hypothetical protein
MVMVMGITNTSINQINRKAVFANGYTAQCWVSVDIPCCLLLIELSTFFLPVNCWSLGLSCNLSPQDHRHSLCPKGSPVRPGDAGHLIFLRD